MSLTFCLYTVANQAKANQATFFFFGGSCTSANWPFDNIRQILSRVVSLYKINICFFFWLVMNLSRYSKVHAQEKNTQIINDVFRQNGTE